MTNHTRENLDTALSAAESARLMIRTGHTAPAALRIIEAIDEATRALEALGYTVRVIIEEPEQ